jgi:hypothetical protein
VNFKKLFVSLFVLLAMHQLSFAQIAKQHYIPPLFGVGSAANYKLVLTTLSETPFKVLITNGDGTFSKEVELSRDAPQEIIPEVDKVKIGLPFVNPISSYPQTNLDASLNKVFTEHGLICKGEKPFFANLMLTMPSQAEVLTSKGTAGLGKKFFTGHQHMNYVTAHNGRVKSHFISVMATQNNTEVEFSNPKLLFYGQTKHTFKVSLNAGETYVVGNSMLGIAKECGETDKCMNDYNGTKVTSNEDISVNSGSIHGGYSKSKSDQSRDIGFDQIVPVEFAGKEFILIEGNGTSGNAKNEVAIIVATQANTTLQVNGKSDATNTYSLLNEGDYVIIPWDKYTEKSMYIQSDKDVYAYQTLAGSSSAVSPGMMFVPRLTLDATKEVYISGINNVGAPSLYLVTESGSTLYINGVLVDSTTVLSVEGNNSWDAYRIQDISPYGKIDSDFHIISTGVLNAAVSFISGAAGGGGYYSGFSKDISNAGIGKMGTRDFNLYCETSLDLVAQGGVKYVWSGTDPEHEKLIHRVNDSTYTFTPLSKTENGLYEFRILTTVETLSGSRQDTNILGVNLMRLDETFGGAQKSCVNEPIQLNSVVSSSLDEYFVWGTSPFLSSSTIGSPIFTGDSSIMDQHTSLTVSFDDGTCKLNGTVKVTTLDCTRPQLQNASIYDDDNDGIAETIRIKFSEPFYDFDKITSIDWPSEGKNDLSSTFQNTSYDTLANGLTDSTRIIIDLTGEFEKGTGVDSLRLPFLDYFWDTIEIDDKVAPIIISAQIVYPKDFQYAILKDDKYEFFESAVEIHIELSEDMIFNKDSIIELFSFQNSNGELVEFDILQSIKKGEKENIWVLSVRLDSETELELVKSISFNSNSKSAISDFDNNAVSEHFVKIEEGVQISRNEFKTVFRDPIHGVNSLAEVRFEDQKIRVYDENGKFLEKIPVKVSLDEKWVAPYNFVDGIFDPEAPCSDDMQPTSFPKKCLTSLAMMTSIEAGPYTAKIFIIDHLGQFVSSWEQRFGDCGEFENPYRKQSRINKSSVVQDLIWNMRDDDGRKVGAGVYFWKVIVEYDAGPVQEIIKDMGSLQSVEECDI